MTVWGLCKVSLLALGIRSAMAKRHRGHSRYTGQVVWRGRLWDERYHLPFDRGGLEAVLYRVEEEKKEIGGD
jgi:hypothetical protein